MLIIFILACFLILLDQLSKNFIVNHFSLGESKEVIVNFFSISSHRNRGAAWGILQDSRLFFLIVTVIFIAILTYYLFKQKNTLSSFDKGTFALIYGGAIGNFIDRLTRHEVVDFLDFRIFGYDFPIFNLADCFICVGVLFLLFKIIKKKINNNKGADSTKSISSKSRFLSHSLFFCYNISILVEIERSFKCIIVLMKVK